MGFSVQKLVGYGSLGPKISGIWDLGRKGYGKHGHKIRGVWEIGPKTQRDMG